MNEANVWEQFRLNGRVALVSGASGWLGGSMAQCLAEAGASVVVSSRDLQRAEQAIEALPQSSGVAHHAVEIDQLQEQSIRQGFAHAVDLAGKVDILVNNGHAPDGHDLTDVQADEFNNVLKNASGWFLLARELRDHVVERKAAGSIINIGSMYGQVASYPDAYADVCPASPVSYHALKGGIIHMTRHLAVYWAKDQIRVNCLSPGPFPGPAAPQEMVQRLKTKSPMGRMGRPDELKGALLLLASDAGSYITGQNITVDGGWTAW